MEIATLKDKIIKTIGGDPFADPRSWDLINDKLPKEHWPIFLDRDGAAKFRRDRGVASSFLLDFTI